MKGDVPNIYDRIIQENFYGPAISLIRKVMPVEFSNAIILSRKMQRSLEKETDMLFKVKLTDGKVRILHIEWQTTNAPDMCNRMFLYNAMIWDRYKIPVIGIVIYIGKAKMNMKNKLRSENLNYQYTLINLTDLDPEVFLRSDSPEEILLAILAGKTKPGTKRTLIKNILYKLHKLLKHDEHALSRKLMQLEILGKLRNVQRTILKEEQNMALNYDLKTDLRYLQGKEQGVKETILERNTAFATHLVQYSDHSDKKISSIVNVSVEFVANIRKSLSKSKTKHGT